MAVYRIVLILKSLQQNRFMIIKVGGITLLEKKKKVINSSMNIFMMMLGTAFVSAGLEVFLIPNRMIDGGIVGISIMAAYLTKLPLAAFLVALNIPFIIVGYFQIGKTFAMKTLFALVCLSAGVTVMHSIPPITDDLILAAAFGGVILGSGVGLIIRNGGSLDGTEILAILFDRRTGFSVGEIIMFFNLFILGSAGLLYGWDRAMYSLLAYFIAYKTIDVMIEGFNETKGIFIVSDQYVDIADAIRDRLGRDFMVFESKNCRYTASSPTIYVVVTRLEISKLKSIVNGFDDNALMTISSVEVEGRKFRKRAIH